MGHFLAGQLSGMGIGFVAGFFTPGVYRRIRVWLGYEKNAVVAEAKSLGKHL